MRLRQGTRDLINRPHGHARSSSALDWGNHVLPARYLIGDDRVLERRMDGPGILRVEERRFRRAALDAMIGPWIQSHGRFAGPPLRHDRQPARVGSKPPMHAARPSAGRPRQGVSRGSITRALAIALVPGLSTENDAMPDVMRGEETQIAGEALAPVSGQDAGLFLLPGTHSKWAEGPGRGASSRSAPS